MVPYDNMELVRAADHKQQECIRNMDDALTACEAISSDEVAGNA